jgi:hypothetical protein
MRAVCTPTRHKGITRVEREGGNNQAGNRIGALSGYLVRVIWKRTTYQKYFSDQRYGDRLGALTAAVEWRDETERSIGKPRTDAVIVGAPRTSASGVRGVRRRIDGHTAYYEATWRTPEGKTRRTRFSISRHGQRRALSRARQARQQGERDRLGI